MEEIIYGNIRVQILSEELIRVELCNRKGEFCDENTFLIPNRSDYRKNRVVYSAEEGVICFGNYEVYLPPEPSERKRSLRGLRIEKNGQPVYTYKSLKNTGELPALDKTPEVFALADTPRVIVPEGGYTYRGEIPNSGYRIEENVQDVYLLLCGKDAKKLRRLYVELTGRNELVRLSVLGGWNSKYFAYSEETAKQLILDYEKYKVPLDNMVIDTDWRAASERGMGYDIDTVLFPDMKRFLRFAHEHGVDIMFNDHPEPLEGAENLLSSSEVKYREEKLQSLMELGLDTWWYDRNWYTRLLTPVKEIPHETFGMHLFYDITRNFYQKQAGSQTKYRRPVIMANVNEVADGRYDEIKSSASHRYSIQWTGDTRSDYFDLKREVENLIRCTDNGIAYVNADCGGHNGSPDKETFIRWMQFGNLSPVFRPHCTKTVRNRDPWTYDEETLEIVREYNHLRYRLLPVIYQNAYENYVTGLPIFGSLGYRYPSDKRAIARKDEYMLGNNLLIAPVVDPWEPEEERPAEGQARRKVYLPAGQWMNVFNGRIYQGGKTVTVDCALYEMPLFVRLGALLPLAQQAKNTKEQTWDRLIYDFYPSKEAEDAGYLYEDDTETTGYQLGEFRKSAYEAGYCGECNAFVVKLGAAVGSFDGEKCFAHREITLRYHLLLGGKQVRQITVNGTPVPFEKKHRDPAAYPLTAAGAVPDGDVLLVTVPVDVAKSYEIKFYLK